MEENLLPITPSFKLYKDRAIYIGTFIGGPLVAGYLAAENFKQLGQEEKAKASWIIAILSTIVIFGGIFLVSNIDKVPRYIIPLIYTLIAQFLVKKYQGDAIETHIEKGGLLYSIWRAVLIGLIGLVILFIVIFIIIMLTTKE